MGIYDKVKAVAKERDVTISEVERLAEVSNGSIGKWNTVSPSVRTLKRVADVLEVPIEELIGD